MGSVVLEQDVADGAPEVAPVGREGVGVVGLDVAALGGLDIVQGDGGLLVEIKGRQEAGLDTDVQLLHFGCIEAEIMAAQGAHADQFHLPLEDVDQHRELVQPGLSHEFTPEIDAVVVCELAAVLQAFVL